MWRFVTEVYRSFTEMSLPQGHLLAKRQKVRVLFTVVLTYNHVRVTPFMLP